MKRPREKASHGSTDRSVRSAARPVQLLEVVAPVVHHLMDGDVDRAAAAVDHHVALAGRDVEHGLRVERVALHVARPRPEGAGLDGAGRRQAHVARPLRLQLVALQLAAEQRGGLGLERDEDLLREPLGAEAGLVGRLAHQLLGGVAPDRGHGDHPADVLICEWRSTYAMSLSRQNGQAVEDSL